MNTMTEAAHDFLKPVLHRQAVCIDATLGQGQDARFFLNHHVRRVFAFEIQKPLVQQARQMLSGPLTCFECGHEQMRQMLPDWIGKIDAAIFNFGYDPKNPQGLHTMTETSLSAALQAFEMLRARGRMALVFYPHPEGVREAQVIEKAFCELDNARLLKVSNPKTDSAPWTLLVVKSRKGII